MTDELYEEAIRTWGERAQIGLLSEECSELSAEASRVLRGRSVPQDLVEEIADVEIMIEQMRVMLDVDAIQSAKVEKRKRLRDRLQEADDSPGSPTEGSEIDPEKLSAELRDHRESRPADLSDHRPYNDPTEW